MNLKQWCDDLASTELASLVEFGNPAFGDVDLVIAKAYDTEMPAVRFVANYCQAHRGLASIYDAKWKDMPESAAFAKLDGELQRDAIVAATSLAALCTRIHGITQEVFRTNESLTREELDPLASVLRRPDLSLLEMMLSGTSSIKQPWDEQSLLLLWRNIPKFHYCFPVKRYLRLSELWANKNEWSEQLAHALQTAIAPYSAYEPELRQRTEDVGKPKAIATDEPRVFELKPCDAWTDTMVQQLNGRNETQQAAWTQLLAHCETAKASSPSKTFLKKATAWIDAIGHDAYVEVMVPVLVSIGSAYGEPPPRQENNAWVIDSTTLVDDLRANLLRGLVWTTSLVDDKALLTALAGAADRCFQKVRNVGPRTPKIGNACLWVFAHSESMEAVAQLNRLMGRVKHASVRKQIEHSLNAAAEHHGLTRSDLEDMAVPTCGLTDVGVMRQTFGDYTAELSILSTSTTKTEWHTPAGKVQKTIPKAVKEEFAAELKNWKANEKLLKQTLSGQRDRLESFYQTENQWTYPEWRERLLDHPLMGWFARRLIWTFHAGDESAAAIWHEGQLVDASGDAIKEPAPDTKVKLWHPIEDTTEGVSAWREWMLTHVITQPFKQAYREVYLLTDAERTTGTYSNRFAAHVIKQHQFRALCQARGWQYDLMGQWDSHNIPEKVLLAHNLRAEFWVDAAGGEAASEAGIFLYLATDQVRFYQCDAEAYARDRWAIRRDGEPLPLDQIPPLVFSEIMRDVDLFVGVASVGNDPNWNDGGPEGQYRDYWHETSFGDLSATAQTRREILERLVPKVKIANRCSFDDKFLIVRGDKRTYKIHLGSSNILMDPNDQYLCIVPGRGAGPGDKVFLPFEGDQRLAVILSKAMMLADDAKIKDSTILSQIGR